MKKVIDKHLESYCKLPELADTLRVIKYEDMEEGRGYKEEELYGNNHKLYKALIDIYLEQGDINRTLTAKNEAFLELEEEHKKLKEELENLKKKEEK